MDGYVTSTYGDTWAEFYDDVFPGPGPDQIDFLVRRAGAGPVLELAVGTGRVALPLMDTGLEVHGVEVSPAMLARLRERPGGDHVTIVGSDMTRFQVSERYPLILLGFNTLFGPLEESAQQGIFESVAGSLADSGVFVIDCFVPDLGRFDRGQTVRVRAVTADQVHLEYSINDAANQINRSMIELRWRDGRSALLPVAVRYMWPEEIDAMAADSGLRLSERYEWYDESPFAEDSPRHVSVYSR